MPLEQVLAAAREWISALRKQYPEIIRVGYFGSYASGDYAPGSDFDVLIEVTTTRAKFLDRASQYLPNQFPVDLDLLVYTSDELFELRKRKAALMEAIDAEVRALA